MDIDKLRVAAVRALEALGYSYRNGEWSSSAAVAAAPLPMTGEADAMHGALMRRADALARKGRTKRPSSRLSST
jgi:hypothetical protein